MTRKEFERQVEAVRPALVRRGRQELQENEVDDAVQDALLIALSKQGWEKIEKPGCWLLGIMDNVIVAVVRKRRFAVADYDLEQAVSDLSQYDDLVDTMAHNEEVSAQVCTIMKAAFQAGLTSREEWVFYARMRGVDDKATAKTLGIEANAVRSYFSLAVKKVKAVVAEDMMAEKAMAEAAV